MAHFKEIDNISRDIPGVGETWEFETVGRYRSSNKITDVYDCESDADDDLSELSMKSTHKNLIAIPPNDITVENSLSKELMKLSVNDRTAIEEEIHGVESDTEETPEFLASCLHKFDQELMTMKNSIRRLEKLKRTQRIENDNYVDSSSSTHVDEDVLRNVIPITPEYKEEQEDEASTASTISSSKKDTGIASGDDNIESKRSCYVNDPMVRLRFLRAERYDPKKAATRFIKFLKFSQELYGDFVADRPVQLSDLKTREEKRALTNVSFQFLPFRDRSGRRVFVSVGTCGYDIETKLRVKVFWYMCWVASEDIESQRKGLVIVGWPSEDKIWEQSLRSSLVNNEGVYQVKTFNGLPMRIAGVHSCFQDRPVYKIISSLFYFALTPYLKTKYKVHMGEPMEIRYKLQGFGIPVDVLPLTHTMAIKRHNHLKWIASRAFIEQGLGGNSSDDSISKFKKDPSKPLTIDPRDVVECPRSYDVIIGKARYKDNPGNEFYRSVIEATHDDHISASKRDKVKLTWRVVRQIEERNGRFLELNKSLKSWVQIKDRDVARQKVAQSLRDYKGRNASGGRTKRDTKQHDCKLLISSVKRRKTVLPKVIEKGWLNGCFSGFSCEYDHNSDASISCSHPCHST